MRDADEKRRSRRAAAQRSLLPKHPANDGIEERAEVLDASGVSWLATLETWLREALDVQSAEPVPTTPTTSPRSGIPRPRRPRSPSSRNSSSCPDAA